MIAFVLIKSIVGFPFQSNRRNRNCYRNDKTNCAVYGFGEDLIRLNPIGRVIKLNVYLFFDRIRIGLISANYVTSISFHSTENQ